MNKKLYDKLGTSEIKQTGDKKGSASPSGSASPRSRQKRSLLAFRDSAIDKITKTSTQFGARRLKDFNFDVSKGSSLKGLQLRFYRQTGKKSWIYNPTEI